MIPDLTIQAERVNGLDDAFTYRLALSGLALQYGRNLLRRALMEAAARAGGNIVSIAAAPNWLQQKVER